jgi:hypothetical protein
VGHTSTQKTHITQLSNSQGAGVQAPANKEPFYTSVLSDGAAGAIKPQGHMLPQVLLQETAQLLIGACGKAVSLALRNTHMTGKHCCLLIYMNCCMLAEHQVMSLADTGVVCALRATRWQQQLHPPAQHPYMVF